MKYDAEGVGGVLNIVMNNADGKAKTKLNGYNGSIAATISNKGYRGSTFLSGQQGKLTYSANLMVSRVRQMEQKQRCAVLHLMDHVWTIGRGVIRILISRWVMLA